MSTADHILDQIDHALHDYDVSDDAMRSAPAATTWRGHSVSMEITDEAVGEPRMWIAPVGVSPDQVGEWQEIGGVATVDIHITTPPDFEEFAQRWADFVERLQARRREEARQAQAAFEAFGRAYAQAVKPAVEAVAQGFAEIQKAMRHVNPPLPPGRRRDRPAWQSPYGPARRRR